MMMLLVCVLLLPWVTDASRGASCEEKALISGPEHHVQDSQLSASSSYPSSWSFGPAQGRLNAEENASQKLGGTWICGIKARGQWIQVDFKRPMFVTSIATRGRSGGHRQWVTSYEVRYSTDGHTWTTYSEGSGAKIFGGNWDPFTISKHQLRRPIVARFVRLNPTTWHAHTSLRWEVYGCLLLDKHCPPGFSHSFTHGTPTHHVTRPYQPSCYRFVTAQKTWMDARTECLKTGGDLVSVESAGEQHHLENVIRGNPVLQKPALTDSPYSAGYWTSGTDEPREGAWMWAATGRAISYTDWASGEPNNKYRGVLPENCLQLRSSRGYKWNDMECTNNFISYICETRALA